MWEVWSHRSVFRALDEPCWSLSPGTSLDRRGRADGLESRPCCCMVCLVSRVPPLFLHAQSRVCSLGFFIPLIRSACKVCIKSLCCIIYVVCIYLSIGQFRINDDISDAWHCIGRESKGERARKEERNRERDRRKKNCGIKHCQNVMGCCVWEKLFCIGHH